MKSILFFLLVSMSIASRSQQLLTDLSGRPFQLKAYDNIKGSAYLFEEWKKGNVTDKYGTTFMNVSLRMDVHANKVYFLHNNSPYEFVTDMVELEFFPMDGDSVNRMIFRKGYTVGDKIQPNKYAQVLVKGKLSLLKFHTRPVDEISEYNVAAKVKTFTPKSELFLVSGNTGKEQKINQKLIEELMADHAAEVRSYIAQNSINLKKEADLVKLTMYYNSL